MDVLTSPSHHALVSLHICHCLTDVFVWKKVLMLDSWTLDVSVSNVPSQLVSGYYDYVRRLLMYRCQRFQAASMSVLN